MKIEEMVDVFLNFSENNTSQKPASFRVNKRSSSLPEVLILSWGEPTSWMCGYSSGGRKEQMVSDDLAQCAPLTALVSYNYVVTTRYLLHT